MSQATFAPVQLFMTPRLAWENGVCGPCISAWEPAKAHYFPDGNIDWDRRINVKELLDVLPTLNDFFWVIRFALTPDSREALRSLNEEFGFWLFTYKAPGNTREGFTSFVAEVAKSRGEFADFGLMLWASSRALLRNTGHTGHWTPQAKAELAVYKEKLRSLLA